MSIRNGALALGLSLLPACNNGCETKEERPETSKIVENITARDQGSQEANKAWAVNEESKLISRQLVERIGEILENQRKAKQAIQSDPAAREFFGSSCASTLYGVEAGAYQEIAPNPNGGYSIQELTSVGMDNVAIPFATSVWGEYKDSQWLGGFSVNSLCIPSGAGEQATAIEKKLREAGLSKELDLSGVLDVNEMARSIESQRKNNLANGETEEQMNTGFSVYFRN